MKRLSEQLMDRMSGLSEELTEEQETVFNDAIRAAHRYEEFADRLLLVMRARADKAEQQLELDMPLDGCRWFLDTIEWKPRVFLVNNMKSAAEALDRALAELSAVT